MSKDNFIFGSLFDNWNNNPEYIEIFEANLKQNATEIVNSQKKEAITPSQLINIVNVSLLNDTEEFRKILTIKGIYMQGAGKPYGNGYSNYYYDYIKDENIATSLQIIVPAQIRQRLKQKSLVLLNGILTKGLDYNRGLINLIFQVSSIEEEVQSNVINEEEMKLLSLIEEKNKKGKKPVKSILKNILMKNDKPKVCLIYAQTTITDQDFDKGVKAAGSEIDFTIVNNIAFYNATNLINKLKELDNKGFDAICIVRGGGSGMERLDNPQLFECLIQMKTPVIGGASHVGEKHFFKSIVDEDLGTPSLLGQYFADLVNDTALEREGTINDIKNKLKKEYAEQTNELKRLKDKSEKDEAEIKKYIEKSKSDAEKYTKICEELGVLKSNKNEQIAAFKKNFYTIFFLALILVLIIIVFGLSILSKHIVFL